MLFVLNGTAGDGDDRQENVPTEHHLGGFFPRPTGTKWPRQGYGEPRQMTRSSISACERYPRVVARSRFQPLSGLLPEVFEEVAGIVHGKCQ